MNSPLDHAFKAMADPERRQLLVALSDHYPLSDQAFDYAEYAHVDPASEAGKNTHLRMLHVHLPLLKAAEFIDWHKDAQEISKGPNFAVIRPLIQVIAGETVAG
jgi:DNA-binding transcriptional ArsR family regulator